MRSTAALVQHVLGQVLTLRVRQGRPTAATFEVHRNYADDDGEPEFSGAATIDAVETTLSASAGAAQSDPQRIPLTSTAGIEARRMYLLREDERAEWVEPIEVKPTYIRVRHPLRGDYTTAATFVSTLISAAVDDAFITDVGKVSDLTDLAPDYRVRWDITVDGGTVPAYSFFDVVAADIGHDVHLSDVNDRCPGLADSLPLEYRVDDGRPLLDAAWRAVKAQFAAISVDHQALRDNEVIDELVILRARKLLAEGGWRPKGIDWSAYLDLVSTEYDRFFEQHFAVTLKHRLQHQATPAETRPPRFWSK